jgi:uncharacterized membrane protein
MKTYLRSLRNNFIAGVALLFPLAVTVLLFTFLVNFLNRWLGKPVEGILGQYVVESHLVIATKILFLIWIVLVIALIGFLTRVIIVRRFFSFWEGIVFKIPMVSKVYTTMKQFGLAIFGEKRKDMFRKVVLVEYPRKGLYALGFITSGKKGKIHSATNKNIQGVFVPTAPNPTSGFLLLVPDDEIIPLDINVEEGFKMVLSMGTLGAE